MARRTPSEDGAGGRSSSNVLLRYIQPPSTKSRERGKTPPVERTARLKVAARDALEWDYVLRNRRRWLGQPAAEDAQVERIEEFLGRSLMDADTDLDDLLSGIAACSLLEVAGPVPPGARKSIDDDDGDLRPVEAPWCAVPWEHLFVAATRASRAEHGAGPLTVMRTVGGLDRDERPREEIRRVLFVASAPGVLGEEFTFDAEREIVHGSLDPKERFEILENPTLPDLAAAMEEVRPDAVHFAGVDIHQGRQILGVREGAGRNLDGMILADERGQPFEATAEQIALALCARRGQRVVPEDRVNLRLVGFNIYNSAARTAPLMVHACAAAAVGFQDEVDDRLAELFFGQLYFAWRQEKVRLDEAFAWAMANMADLGDGLRGAGMALWGDRHWDLPSVAEGHRRQQRRLAALDREKIHAMTVPASRWSEPVAGRARRPAEAPEPPDVIEVPRRPSIRFEAPRRLNYAMLHNSRPVFDVFSVGKVAGAPDRVRVRVQLHTGAGEVGAFEQVLRLVDAVHDLRGSVRLPLLSTLWRSMREGIQTTLTVTVSTMAEGTDEVILLETRPVTLLPPDEWTDTEDDRIWLPSFVLPRDEAIRDIVDRAQRYLMAFSDDRDAGFDGYQSVPSAKEVPDREERFEPVDNQVRAIWSALVHDLGLKYINPPPTYTELSQRLRRPCDIVAGGRGTCIDLALLFAACLEYVEIYPVLFLIEGHAFPGFWRSDEAHEAFVQMRMEGDDEPARASARTERLDVQEWPWCIGSAAFREIRGHVSRGDIVPVESTCIAFGGSFFESLDLGAKNLANPREFNAMLDVITARRSGVTPIPMPTEEGRAGR